MFDFQTLLTCLREGADSVVHFWHELEKYVAPMLVMSGCIFRNVPTLTLLLAVVVVVHNWLTAAH